MCHDSVRHVYLWTLDACRTRRRFHIENSRNGKRCCWRRQSKGAGRDLAPSPTGGPSRECDRRNEALQVRNDFDGIVRVLSSRADELDVVIAKVSASGFYSIRDKQIMLRVLEKDRKWARESYLGLATL